MQIRYPCNIHGANSHLMLSIMSYNSIHNCCASATQIHINIISEFSLHFNGHFSCEPGLAGVYWMMEVVVTTGAISCAKLQSNHHHQQTNTQFFTGQMPFLSPNQQCQSTEGRKYHIPWTSLLQAHLGVFKLCLWPLIAPGYIGEGCHASHQPSDASTPKHNIGIDYIHNI